MVCRIFGHADVSRWKVDASNSVTVSAAGLPTNRYLLLLAHDILSLTTGLDSKHPSEGLSRALRLAICTSGSRVGRLDRVVR